MARRQPLLRSRRENKRIGNGGQGKEDEEREKKRRDGQSKKDERVILL